MALITLAAAAQTQDDTVTLDDANLSASSGAYRTAQGKALYVANCASCHGANLEGQSDWRRRLDTGRMPAPPHDETGHTWHHPDAALLKIIKSGLDAVIPGYESDMPAFGSTLSDAEITDVLAYIKSTWPDRQRDFQAEVTANDLADP
ncbi:c-type cytochrome [Loktanella sp. DJP18]|uniref:c-type cytochrome n=1 Tax=Loktanella sp. DJP18 TaxID=3409788 RepID=UPI003BB64683